MSENTKVTISNYSKLAYQTKKEMSTMVLPIDNMPDNPLVIDTKRHLGVVLDNIHMAMGIVGEFGELEKAEANDDIPNIIEESGDILWFVGVSCEDNNISFEKLVNIAFDSLDVADSHAKNGYDHFGLIDFIKKYGIYNDGYGVAPEDFSIQLEPYLANIIRMVINQTYWRGESGFDIETILQINFNKLFSRFGGKFSQYFANNRDLDKEREILEVAQ